MSSDDQIPRDRGRWLHAESTEAERKLWKHLRAKRFDGFQFRRQHRIGPYFADLCCVKQHLIVELDGGHHAEQQERDATRTAYLTEQGYRVICFWNEQVNREIDNVLEAIYAALADS
jgi:very-short-patch-repair endonuclease